MKTAWFRWVDHFVTLCKHKINQRWLVYPRHIVCKYRFIVLCFLLGVYIYATIHLQSRDWSMFSVGCVYICNNSSTITWLVNVFCWVCKRNNSFTITMWNDHVFGWWRRLLQFQDSSPTQPVSIVNSKHVNWVGPSSTISLRHTVDWTIKCSSYCVDLIH
jgi:hypothetical protein